MRAATEPANALVYVSDDAQMDSVEAAIKRWACGSHVDPLTAWFGAFVETGGKRLRARVALASATCLGASRHRAVPWAAAVELMHNATLIHDDIQDGDSLRRGEPATWVRHGVGQAINIGDFGLMLPFMVVGEMVESAEVRAELSRILAQQGVRAARGQRAMLALLSEGQFSKEAYVQAVTGTTGSFFSLPIQGSAILAGFSEAQARLMGDAFLPVGVLFQLQDDILDLYGEKGRDKRGSDLRDGKVSALVVEHLALRPDDAAWLIPLLERERSETSDEDVAYATSRFRQSGALRGCLEDIDRISRELLASAVFREHPWLSVLASDFINLVLRPLRGL